MQSKTQKHTRGISSETTDKFIRVGDDYLELIERPNSRGDLRKGMMKRSKSTIIDDFGRKSIDTIKKYTGFCNTPSHTNFKQEINGFFNNYAPLQYEPIDGLCENIMNIFKHIFREKEQFEMALDYVQILYQFPERKLPILCLVSEETNTGKSTFAELLACIFGNNSTKIGNSDLENQFNAHYIEKLLIILDETSIDKQAVTQVVKRLSTEKGNVTVNQKGIAQYQSEFIGKFIFISNDEERFMHIEEKDTRFWITKVHKIENEINDFSEIMKKEISHFLYFLTQRKLYHKDVSRLYFDAKLFETDAKQKAKEANLHPVKKAVLELVKDTFEAYTDINEFRASLIDILKELKDDNVKYLTKSKLREVLLELETEKKCTKPDKSGRYDFHSLKLSSEISQVLPTSHQKNGRAYLFKVQKNQDLKNSENDEKKRVPPLNIDSKGLSQHCNTLKQEKNKNDYPNFWD